ncbi:patatin-like phospholipase family protein [Alkalimarinus coralli]|uniref:patatin-like phospholipase family protein n=1 Tax=Alkalimarinus coralli TaxID=2935863 RepID=UPI00202B9755|nr:patatin-like phospholipase family protein [Alkalimarinus coralli]
MAGKQLITSLIYALLLSSLTFTCSAADATPSRETPQRPVIGLVLSGGGAKGLAHVGVLKVLEEMKVPVDIVVGTSAGSAVAGLYASGLPVDEIEERFHRMIWDKGFTDESSRADKSFRRKQDDFDFATDLVLGVDSDGIKFRKGLIQGQQLMLLLSELTSHAAHIDNFDQFPIRYRAVASDIGTGETVAVSKGSLATAMRASMSIPGAFPPVEYEGRLLVDGGISDNLPIDVARDLGAELIIAVDISSPLLEADEVNSLVGVVEQLTNLLTRRNVEEQLASLTPQDILLIPDLQGAGSGDFQLSDEIVEMGATSARNSALALKALSIDDESWLAFQEKRTRAAEPIGSIDRIEVVNQSGISPEFITSRISQPVGKPLDREVLEHDINVIYGLGYFERVTYDLIDDKGESVLQVSAVEKSWGPDYLRFGLNFEDNLTDDTDFNIALHYDQTSLNRWGAEWQTSLQLGSHPFLETEFYQPIPGFLDYFVALGGLYEERTLPVFNQTDKLSEWDITETNLSAAVGREFGSNAELRVEYILGKANLKLDVGNEPITELNEDVGSISTSFTYDSLDKLFLPHEGVFFHAEWEASRQDLAATLDYDRVAALVGGAYTVNRYTVVGRLSAAKMVRDQAALSNLVSLGGLFNLSGYSRDTFVGHDAALASVIAYREFGGPFIPYMAGFSYETGNVWQDLDDASWGDVLDSYTVFVGSDTPLGPVTFAGSYADSDNQAIYLMLGYDFYALF